MLRGHVFLSFFLLFYLSTCNSVWHIVDCQQLFVERMKYSSSPYYVSKVCTFMQLTIYLPSESQMYSRMMITSYPSLYLQTQDDI